MRLLPALACALLSLLLTACSGIEIQRSPIEPFAAGDFRYYKWRSEPLPAKPGASDPLYTLDPLVRREMDALLQQRGFVLDASRAQFTVDYQYISGLRQGARSQLAENITPWPSVSPNRQVNQAAVDNAIALSGVQTTNNLILQFNDRATNRVLWQVTLTRIVEDVNNAQGSGFEADLPASLRRALQPLPPAR